MKKTLIILMIVVFSLVGLSSISFAQTSEDIFEYAFMLEEGMAFLEDNLSFLGAYGSYALQSGQYANTDVALINVGLTANLAFVDFPQFILDNFDAIGTEETQILKDYSMLPMGFLYVGLKLPFLPIKLYARGLYLPEDLIPGLNEPVIIAGGGAAITFDLAILEITATANYHFMNGISMIDLHSYGAQGIVAFNIPVLSAILKPYVGIGWSSTTVTVNLDLTELYGAPDIASLPANVMDDPEVAALIAVTDGKVMFSKSFTYVGNFPLSLGVRFNLLFIKIIAEYTTTMEKLFTWPIKGGAISLSLGVGF